MLKSTFYINGELIPSSCINTDKIMWYASGHNCWRSLTTISRRQLDQKIMRVCISYTHPYPIKFLNHTVPFRICKLCFQANMQVASTLWPDIKSQKLSEHRFRLRWTKSDARTQFKQVKTGQAQRGSDKRGPWQPTRRCWGRLLARAGRPTYLVGRPGLWAPPPQPGHVAPPHWSLTSVVKVLTRGSLL